MLQARLDYQTSLRVFSQATDRVIEFRKCLQRANARSFQLFHLTTADIRNIEQAVLGLPDAFAMIGPAAQPRHADPL